MEISAAFSDDLLLSISLFSFFFLSIYLIFNKLHDPSIPLQPLPNLDTPISLLRPPPIPPAPKPLLNLKKSELKYSILFKGKFFFKFPL